MNVCNYLNSGLKPLNRHQIITILISKRITNNKICIDLNVGYDERIEYIGTNEFLGLPIDRPNNLNWKYTVSNYVQKITIIYIFTAFIQGEMAP
jgi:hypothetical protein